MAKNKDNTVYINVGECLLTTSGRDIPVAKFDVSFALNDIPKASLVLATGRSLEGDNGYPVQILEEGEEAEITLLVDEEKITLLKGFITSISGSDNAGLFKRTTSLVVHVSHKARVLAGSPPSSYVYTGDNQQLSIVQKQLVAVSQFGTTVPGAKTDFNSYSGFSKAFDKRGTPLDAASLLQFTTESLAKQFTPHAEDFATNLLKLPGGTTVSKFALPATSFVRSVANKYREAWSTANSWEALRRAANYVFLSLVPYNEGMYIAPTLSLYRGHSVEISPEDYTSWAPGIRGTTDEPVDGVVASVPLVLGGGTAFKIAFPPVEGNTSKNLKVKQNRYYHFRQLPAWILPVASKLYGKGSGKVDKENKGAVEDKPIEMEGDNLESHVKTAGEAVVKLLYAQLKMQTQVARITVPFRTDLMPGTNVKFLSSDAEAVDFIGDELYGMITRASFSGDMTQGQGSLSVNLDIATLRNKQDNENDAMTFAEHPVYDKVWEGVSLEGTRPDGSEIKSPTTLGSRSSSDTESAGQDTTSTDSSSSGSGMSIRRTLF
jgi:hypothetical protein